jgi:CheY-like chemotaxis protein
LLTAEISQTAYWIGRPCFLHSGTKRGHMQPIVKKWPMVLGGVLVAALAGAGILWVDWDKAFDAVEEWQRPKPKVVQLGPTVLLLSKQERDRYLVKSTLEPRGYTVQMVDTVAQGREALDGAPIVMVVVDSAFAGSKKLLQAAKAKFPNARLIELRGRRDASEVTGALVNAVSGT